MSPQNIKDLTVKSSLAMSFPVTSYTVLSLWKEYLSHFLRSLLSLYFVYMVFNAIEGLCLSTNEEPFAGLLSFIFFYVFIFKFLLGCI